MKTTVQYAMQAALCFVAFVIIQFAVMLCTRMIVKDITLNATALIVSSLVASAITIALFAWRRWTVMSRSRAHIRKHDKPRIRLPDHRHHSPRG